MRLLVLPLRLMGWLLRLPIRLVRSVASAMVRWAVFSLACYVVILLLVVLVVALVVLLLFFLL